MTFDHDSSAGYIVNKAARLFARELEAGIRPLGIGLGVFPALLLLWQKDGQTQRDLVERLAVEQPTMAATLARMERDGLITRRRDDADARVQRIHLTARARALEKAATAAAARVNDAALAALDGAERAMLLALLWRVIGALDTTAPPDAATAGHSGP